MDSPIELSKKNKIIIVVVAVVVIILLVVIFSKRNPGGGSSVSSDQQGTTTEAQPVNAFAVDLNTVDFNAPVSPISSPDISAADKKAVYEALLSSYKIMTSGNVQEIRTYMSERAATPPEKNLITKMSDATILSLSARLSNTMVMPVPKLLLAKTSIWLRDGNGITVQYMDPNTGTTTKRILNIDGKWY